MFDKLFPKIVPFMRLCGKKYGRAREVLDGIIIQRMRISCGIINTKNIDPFRMFNSYCFYTIITVFRKRLIVTLYVNFLSCYCRMQCFPTKVSAEMFRDFVRYRGINT